MILQPTVNTKKLDTLLIIRGLLALSVVVWHSGMLNANTTALINIPGRTAVWMFFGISGYVISYGFYTKRYLFTKKDLKAFYLNRFLRIYPLFFLLSLIALLTEYFINGKIAMQFSDIFSQLFMLQFNHDYTLNNVFWTLGIEVQFYIIAPLLVAFIVERFQGKWLLLAAIYFLFVCYVPFAFYFFGQSFDGRNLPANLSHFFAGMLACKLVLENKPVKINRTILVVLLLGIIAVTNYFYAHNIKFYWSIGSVGIDMAIVISILLHHGLSSKTYSGKNYTVRVFTFLGLISYGVYAWHPYLTKYIPAIETNTLFVVAVTVLIASLSYQFIEKPILSLKSKRRKEEFSNR
jgi:peptidoglycan/LPS O-acetylase OafA/YrhL